MSDTSQPTWFARSAAVLAVAATYFYFLIYAEFALLALAGRFAPPGAGVLPALALLGVGGIAGSFSGAAAFQRFGGGDLLAWTFRCAALGAALAVMAKSLPLFLVACALSGVSLGALTVVLSARLRSAFGASQLGLGVGLGTGLAYGCSNLPGVFQAPAATQASGAALVALAASFASRWLHPVAEPPAPSIDQRGAAGAAWIIMLLALVGLDSGAFYEIQHDAALFAGTWSQSAQLWGNATVHLLAAVAAGWCFDRGWRARLTTIALLLLLAACALLAQPAPGPWPRLMYTAGVSLYSVVLVAYPALGASPWSAARLFALAGWGGSAAGVGLVLRHPDSAPVGMTVAVILFWTALAFRQRALRLGVAMLALLAAWPKPVRAEEPEQDILRGREVYIAEGCINCHSQYVRPQVTADVERWGPATLPGSRTGESPPLYGNRRQGPDLANVGLRRSAQWNQLHLVQPQVVSPGTVMPSYAHLFAAGDSRGPELLTYLASLGAERGEERERLITQWRPTTNAAADRAPQLFAALCVACHGPDGRGDGALSASLVPVPPDWRAGPRRQPAPGEDPLLFLARIIKFGLPATPMAGREYLSDEEVVSLARHVQRLQSGGATGR